MYDTFSSLLQAAQRIVVLQADNPDADSLGSALALEHILSDQGKDVALYCGVNIPDYLKYMSGWDRVLSDLPSKFDASIIVDASTYVLFEKLSSSNKIGILQSKPCIVLDHHAEVDKKLDFASVSIIDPSMASTGDIIFDIASNLAWDINAEAAAHLMSSILGDTQGLTNELTTARTFRTMAELTDLGAKRPALEELRREYGKMPQKIYSYKADLIKKTKFEADNRVASVVINQQEINEFSPLYNPVPLIQTDILQVQDVCIGIVYKVYSDGRITAAIRSTSNHPIAGKLAIAFGGGGHPHASGFKIIDGRSFDEIQSECLKLAITLLNESDKDKEANT